MPLRTRPRPPGPEPSRSGPVARWSLGLAGMSRRHHREPYDPSVSVVAVPHASGASGDLTRLSRGGTTRLPRRRRGSTQRRHRAPPGGRGRGAARSAPGSPRADRRPEPRQRTAAAGNDHLEEADQIRPATWSSGPIGPGTCSKQRRCAAPAISASERAGGCAHARQQRDQGADQGAQPRGLSSRRLAKQMSARRRPRTRATQDHLQATGRGDRCPRPTMREGGRFAPDQRGVADAARTVHAAPAASPSGPRDCYDATSTGTSCIPVSNPLSS